MGKMLENIKEMISLPKRFIELSRQYQQLYDKNREEINDFYQDIYDYLYFGGPELIAPALPKETHIQLIELVCDAIKHNDFRDQRYFFTEDRYFKRFRDPQIGFEYSWNLKNKSPEGIYLYYHYNRLPLDSLNFIFLDGPAIEENFEDLGRIFINSRQTRVRLPDQDLDYFLVEKFNSKFTYCTKHTISEEDELALRRMYLF